MWSNGESGYYRAGDDGHYDLEFDYDPSIDFFHRHLYDRVQEISTALLVEDFLHMSPMMICDVSQRLSCIQMHVCLFGICLPQISFHVCDLLISSSFCCCGLFRYVHICTYIHS